MGFDLQPGRVARDLRDRRRLDLAADAAACDLASITLFRTRARNAFIARTVPTAELGATYWHFRHESGVTYRPSGCRTSCSRPLGR